MLGVPVSVDVGAAEEADGLTVGIDVSGCRVGKGEGHSVGNVVGSSAANGKLVMV